MNKNRMKKDRYGIAGLLLAGVVVFASAGAVFAEGSPSGTAGVNAAFSYYSAAETEAASSYYIQKEHADMDYADMVYTPVDPHALDDALAELDAITDGTGVAADPMQRTVGIYEEILQILDGEYTNYVLGDIAHYRNVNDEELNEKNRQDTLAIQDMSDAAYLSLQRALMGPYGEKLRGEFSEDQLGDLEEYEALTDRERELTDRETELQQTYDRLSEDEYIFEYEGREWTLEDLYADPPEDYDDIVAVYLGLSKQMDDVIVPVFQEMIQTRKEIAEAEGYDTYTDYCYDVNYGRDFTGEDIAALRQTVIEELRPLYEELRMMQYMSDFDTELAEPLSGEEIVDTIAQRIGNVHPELTEAFDYLREHKLYCIDNTNDMVVVGFTSDLPAYGSAFIFDKTGGTIHDLETIVHEFGHFNAAYHAKQNVLTDSLLVDVAEIQSQGLEMLFMDEMKQILPDDPEGLQLYLLVNMLDSVLTGFEYDEFQQEIYSRGEMTQEELNRLAMDIDNKYTQYFYDDDGEAYEWVLVNHTFTSPLYYIGYATSALSALDIWTQSLNDRDTAIEKYMKLTAVPLDMPYQEATTGCGLRNMLDPENIRELAEEIRDWAGLETMGWLNGPNFPDFDVPFGFDEEDPFSWGEMMPGGEENSVLPYEYEVEPYSPEAEPYEYGTEPYEYETDPYESGPGSHENGSDSYYVDGEYLEEIVEEVGSEALRVAGVATSVNGVARILVLIIALIAFFRKRKRNRDNYGGPGEGSWGNYDGPDEGGWNNYGGPDGDSWNNYDGSDGSDWNNYDGPDAPGGWR